MAKISWIIRQHHAMGSASGLCVGALLLLLALTVQSQPTEEELIGFLDLAPLLPEGGFLRETFRRVLSPALPPGTEGICAPTRSQPCLSLQALCIWGQKGSDD